MRTTHCLLIEQVDTETEMRSLFHDLRLCEPFKSRLSLRFCAPQHFAQLDCISKPQAIQNNPKPKAKPDTLLVQRVFTFCLFS